MQRIINATLHSRTLGVLSKLLAKSAIDMGIVLPITICKTSISNICYYNNNALSLEATLTKRAPNQISKAGSKSNSASVSADRIEFIIESYELLTYLHVYIHVVDKILNC